MARLTLDIDGENRDDATVKMLARYFAIKHIWPDAEVRVDLTRKGYHIVVYGLDVPQERIIELREVLGDDGIRVQLDTAREPVGSNILWTVKKGFRVKKDIKVI